MADDLDDVLMLLTAQ